MKRGESEGFVVLEKLSNVHKEENMNVRRLLLVVIMTSLCATTTFAGKSHGSTTTTPGKFDYYVLALSWQPAFCESHTEKAECKKQTGERFDAKNLALHGLWPNKRGDTKHTYAYCGVSKKVRNLDKPETWCSMPKINLTDKTQKELAEYMPGYASCLQNHEWYKHGTCTGLKQNDYFAIESMLDAKIADTNFGKYISTNVGKTVVSDNLLAEFEKDYGAGSRKYVNLYCENTHGVAMLSEVRIYLKKQLPKNGAMNGFFALPDKSERGDCPDTILIDQAGVSGN
jgi:ribonuclease T2